MVEGRRGSERVCRGLGWERGWERVEEVERGWKGVGEGDQHSLSGSIPLVTVISSFRVFRAYTRKSPIILRLSRFREKR